MKQKAPPKRGLTGLRLEGLMETREQTIAKIEFHLPTLTDEQLRMVAGFIRGIKKNQG